MLFRHNSFLLRTRSGETGMLQLTSINGQSIWQKVVRSNGSKQIESIELQAEPSGHYIFQLTTTKGIVSRQIIKL